MRTVTLGRPLGSVAGLLSRASLHGLYFARILLQGCLFVAMASVLSLRDYGRFALLSASASVAIPWAFAGMDIVLVRLLAQAKLSLNNLRRVSRVAASAAFIVLLVTTPLATVLSSSPLLVAFTFCFAELVLLPAYLLSAQTALGLGRSSLYGALTLTPVLIRACALLWVWYSGTSNPLRQYVLAECALGMAACLLLVKTFLAPSLKSILIEDGQGEADVSLGEGLSYAIGLSCRGIYNDSDKMVLGRVLGPEAAAVYTVGYRLLSFAQAPAQAFAAAYFPRLLSAQEDREVLSGIYGRLRIKSLMSGLLGASGMLVAAFWLLPLVLPQYQASTTYAAALSLVAVTSAASSAMADLVTACGSQSERLIAQGAVSIVSPFLTWGLVLACGIWGGVLSTLTCEVLLLAMLAAQVNRLRFQSKGSG